MAGIAAFYPGFIVLRSFFQMLEELLILKCLPSLRYHRTHPVPDPEKLATGLKEEVFVEQTVVEHGAGLIPIGKHHHDKPALVRHRPRDSHPVVEIFREEVLEEPIAALAQLGLAAHFVDLQVELRLDRK